MIVTIRNITRPRSRKRVVALDPNLFEAYLQQGGQIIVQGVQGDDFCVTLAEDKS